MGRGATPACIQCGRAATGPRADHLFNRPDGSEVWLCSRQQCADDYNDNVPPGTKRKPEPEPVTEVVDVKPGGGKSDALVSATLSMFDLIPKKKP